MKHFAMALLATTALSTNALADDGSPQPPEGAKELHCLVGSWTGTGTLEAGGDKANVELTYQCRKVSGGFGVACDGAITGVPGLASYEFHDMWGYDPNDGSTHWFVITNIGETHDHKGKVAKDAFTGRFVGKRDGKKFVEDVSFTFSDKNHFRVSSVGRVDGKQVEKIEISVRKDGKGGRRASR